jgi:hypothetical protein
MEETGQPASARSRSVIYRSVRNLRHELLISINVKERNKFALLYSFPCGGSDCILEITSRMNAVKANQVINVKLYSSQ